MKAFHFTTSHCLFIEIGQSSLKALDGDEGLELPLERLENGRLTNACKERLTLRLRELLKHKNTWLSRPRAFCAIGARGVSLRRFTLPASTKEELHRLLALQIENEFPLPPDELAWGYRQLNLGNPPRNGTASSQEVLVVAAKKEVLEQYSDILCACGLSPVFSLGALARSSLCSQLFGSSAVLDIGRHHSELISFDNGVPSAVRILPWGGENLTHSIENALKISRDEAERLKINLDHDPACNGELGQKVQTAIRAELPSLARAINHNGTLHKIYLAGRSAQLKDFTPWLKEALGGGVECERIMTMPGEGRSAAILGLKTSWENDGVCPLLIIEAQKARSAEPLTQPTRWKWAALAVLLCAGFFFSLRYSEAFFLKPRLSRTLSEMKSLRERLPKIDRELGFLQYLETNQAPYLDMMTVLANAAPPGTRIDSLTMNRGGDVSIRATMQISQPTEFRSKLIDSGIFSIVILDEQTPAPDRQRVTVRMTAQCKPAGARPPVVVNPSPPKNVRTDGPEGMTMPDALPSRGAPLPLTPVPDSVPVPGAKEQPSRSQGVFIQQVNV